MMMYDDLIKQLRHCANATTCRHCPWRSECCLHDAQRKAADAIEELMRRCEQFQYMPPPAWIPVSVRLPDGNGEYFVSGKGKVWVCEFMILGNVGGWCNSAMNPCVEYWMPLPEAPKDGET